MAEHRRPRSVNRNLGPCGRALTSSAREENDPSPSPLPPFPNKSVSVWPPSDLHVANVRCVYLISMRAFRSIGAVSVVHSGSIHAPPACCVHRLTCHSSPFEHVRAMLSAAPGFLSHSMRCGSPVHGSVLRAAALAVEPATPPGSRDRGASGASSRGRLPGAAKPSAPESEESSRATT